MTYAPGQVLIVAGPTASGKSAYALRLAQDNDGVIINADSLQIYDALPLLTAQPSPEEQAQVPHRLYSHLQPDEKCAAPLWRDLALREIRCAQESGRLPVIVGGTGLYIRALTDGLSKMPSVPAETRAQTMDLQRGLGNPAFHAALEKIDPVMAARLHPQDTQRLIRAYEVMAATGKSLAYWQEQPAATPPEDLRFETHVILPDRAVLRARCDRRFDMMLAQGALEEVAAFARRIESGDVSEDSPALHALGFRGLRDYLRGRASREEAVEKAKAETRQYAKRQVTWFRNQVRPDIIVN